MLNDSMDFLRLTVFTPLKPHLSYAVIVIVLSLSPMKTDCLIRISPKLL